MSKRPYHKARIGAHELKPATQMMSYGYDPFMSEGAVKPPVFLTSTFAFRSAEEGAAHFDLVAGRRSARDDEQHGLIYSRFNHPNLEIVEDRLALLDGSDAAVVTASGMAAISTALLALLRPGDVVLQSAPLYGGTETLLQGLLAEWGVTAMRLPDALDADSCRQALAEAGERGRLRVVYIETPANPTNAVIDFELLTSAIAQHYEDDEQRPVTICDNTLLGPVFQQPARHGIDLCVYSLTKYVGGHSDLVAGGVTGAEALINHVRRVRSAIGTQLDPHTCWLIARSMETLILRMERAAETASRVAAWLADNPWLPCRVLHPEHDMPPATRALFERQSNGYGSTFSFVLDGDRALAFRVVNALELFKLAVSLGGSESLVCHPASTTHSGVPPEGRLASGVSEGLIRVSVGLEDADDLIADLEQAFRFAAEA